MDILKIEDAEDFAKKLLEREKHVMMQIVVETDEGMAAFVFPEFDDNGKEQITKMMRQKISDMRPNRYFTIQEGWMGSNEGVRPSKDPNKKECLLVIEYRRDLKHTGGIWIFHREGDKIVWDERMAVDGAKDYYSRYDFYREDVMDEMYKAKRAQKLIEEFDKAVPDSELQDLADKLKFTGFSADVKELREKCHQMIKDGRLRPEGGDEP